jgi:putative endonuclease
MVDGFAKDYKVHNLVYYEATNEVESALTREKQLKKWKRAWKIELIEQNNSEWIDLYPNLL